MNTSHLVAALTILGAVLGQGEYAMADTPFSAGAAAVTVNPPIGAYIGGDRLNRKFTGVNDDLFAKALVISDGDETIALVTVDCLGITYPTIQEIQQLAAEKTTALKLDPKRVVVGSSHIHNGPDVVGIYGPDQMHTGLDPEYMTGLVEKAAGAVAQAAAKAVPVSARYAQTTHGEEWVRNVCEPEEVDRSVTTLQLLDAQGASVATLTNFACHPTILDGVHDVVSADWVGGFYRAMGEALPGEHLFYQGSIGGWIQPVKGDRSFALANRYGSGLAEAVQAALAEAKPLAGDSVAFARAALPLPLANEGWAALSELGVLVPREMKDTVLTEVVAFRIGEASFASHPGETAPAFGFQTKDLMKTEGPKFVLGLTQDALGYILKPSYFEEGATFPDAEYLTRMSVGPETGPLMMKALAEAVPQAEE